VFLPPAAARPLGGPGAHAAFALPAAPWRRRAGAFLLDQLVQILITVAVAALVAVITGGESISWEYDEDGETSTYTLPYWLAWASVVGLVLAFTYPWLALGLTGGRSPGRRAARIRVVRYDGTPVGLGPAFLRDGVTKGLLGAFGVPLILSFLWPLWDPHQRALHDLVCSTRAVRDDPGDAGVPTYASVADDDVAARIGLGG
jgi:uncharacterized RDD family membrane protein YckC